MECFAHPSSTALGICKSCGKGICRACAISVDYGLACSKECAVLAKAISQFQRTQVRNAHITSASRIVLPLFSVVALGLGVFLLAKGNSDIFTWFYIVLGGGTGLALLMSKGSESSGNDS